MAKRQRRRKMPQQMRRYSSQRINTGSGPVSGVLREYRDRTHSLKTTMIVEDRFANTAPGKVLIKGQAVLEERKAVDMRRVHIEKNYINYIVDEVLKLLGDQNPDYCVKMPGKNIITRMYFNETHSSYFFIRHNQITRTIEKSTIYSSSEIAKREYQFNRVMYPPNQRIIYDPMPED